MTLFIGIGIGLVLGYLLAHMERDL